MTFTKKDIGTECRFKTHGGDLVPAKIEGVTRDTVKVVFFVAGSKFTVVMTQTEADWKITTPETTK